MKTIYWCVVLLCAMACSAVAGTDVFLKIDGSNRVAAQIKPDADGSFTLANLPDGKYKIEVVVGTKRFILDADCDGDGSPDLAITTLDATGKPIAQKGLPKTLRLLIPEKGQKKVLTMSEWMQKTAQKTAWTTAGTFEICVEVSVSGNTMKGKIRCSDGACM